MTEEIKEILFQLEIVARKHTIKVTDTGNIETMPASVVHELRLNNYSAKILLNYITNLQKENEKLKEENKRIFSRVNDDELLISNAMNYAELQDYKLRNEKAIEYFKNLLKEEVVITDEESVYYGEKVQRAYFSDSELGKGINILQGGDE